MNKKEAAQLLDLIKLSYPAAYRDMDGNWMMATINMWQMSFKDVPYFVIEQAFNHHRMVSKFPPSVAEIAENLRKIHFEANQLADIQRTMDNREKEAMYRRIEECTKDYRNWPDMGMAGTFLVGNRIGGNQNAGAPGDRLDRTDRLPLLDAGGR